MARVGHVGASRPAAHRSPLSSCPECWATRTMRWYGCCRVLSHEPQERSASPGRGGRRSRAQVIMERWSLCLPGPLQAPSCIQVDWLWPERPPGKPSETNPSGHPRSTWSPGLLTLVSGLAAWGTKNLHAFCSFQKTSASCQGA